MKERIKDNRLYVYPFLPDDATEQEMDKSVMYVRVVGAGAYVQLSGMLFLTEGETIALKKALDRCWEWIEEQEK